MRRWWSKLWELLGDDGQPMPAAADPTRIGEEPVGGYVVDPLACVFCGAPHTMKMVDPATGERLRWCGKACIPGMGTAS